MNIRICFVALFLMSATSASAGIVSVSGQIQQIAPPFSVQQGAAQNNSAGGIFVERQDFILPVAISLNASTSGVFNETADLTPGTVPQGTMVNSYLIHLDRNQLGPLSGTVVFAEAVLGAIFLQPELQASHPIVGRNDVAYPANASADAQAAQINLGSGGDEVQINKSQNLVMFYSESNFFNSEAYDHIRIITAASAVPEPAAEFLMLSGVVAMALRRQG